jgi:hypothetical protein
MNKALTEADFLIIMKKAKEEPQKVYLVWVVDGSHTITTITIYAHSKYSSNEADEAHERWTVSEITHNWRFSGTKANLGSTFRKEESPQTPLSFLFDNYWLAYGMACRLNQKESVAA